MRKIRFTIGGLMTLVLVVAIAFAAVRNADPTWSGVLALLTYGTLGVAILGIVFRRGAERAWWFGYWLFGWGYLRLAPWAFSHAGGSPTRLLLLWVRKQSGSPPPASDPYATENLVLSQIDRCLWAIPAALLGGLLVRLLFVSNPVGPDRPRAALGEPARPAWKLAILPVGIGLAGLILMRLMMVLWWTSDPGLWGGGTYLVTCALLGIATLGALLGRGKPREIWIGASLFGVGYLYMAMVSYLSPFDETAFLHPRATDRFLDALRPLMPPVSSGTARENGRIFEALERPIPMRFPVGTSLDELLKYLKQATAARGQPDLLIYVDPIGLQEAGRSLNSTVRMDLEGVPLKATLKLCLRPLGLYYVVKDGALRISGDDEVVEPEGEESFRIVGHSLLALLAAGVGGVLAPLVSAVSRERTGHAGDTPAPGRSAEDRAGSSSES